MRQHTQMSNWICFGMTVLSLPLAAIRRGGMNDLDLYWWLGYCYFLGKQKQVEIKDCGK